MCHNTEDLDNVEYDKIVFLREKIYPKQKDPRPGGLMALLDYNVCDYIYSYPWLSIKYQKNNPDWTIDRDKTITDLQDELKSKLKNSKD